MKYSISGLETLTITPSSNQIGLRHLDAKISIPRPSQGAATPSQVVATVKQNGTTLATSTAGSDGITTAIVVSAGDSITVQLTSSQAEDQVLNAVKAVVTLS